MAAFLTHWRVLIETARRSQDAGSDLGSLIVDAGALRRRLRGTLAFSTPPQTSPAGAVWDTGPLPEIAYHFPGSDISAMAYLGALAPDITHHQTSSRPHAQQNWARLLHTRRTGDLLLTFLEQIAQIPSPALRSQALAFCLGYLSHIATDIALNPWINVLAATHPPRTGPFPSSIESCIDEYIAATYFEHPLYSWTNRPWRNYIEPAARNITVPATIAAQVFELLASAAEVAYALNAREREAFHSDYLAGLQRLRRHLAGRGLSRWQTLDAHFRRRHREPILATIAAHQQQAGTTTFEEVLEYAIRLSERLCRRAIGYYATLRNTQCTAEERSLQRSILCDDLRNWNLTTGYTLDISFDEEISIRFLHNWIHFADLWNVQV